jgi:hypothetical protein
MAACRKLDQRRVSLCAGGLRKTVLEPDGFRSVRGRTRQPRALVMMHKGDNANCQPYEYPEYDTFECHSDLKFRLRQCGLHRSPFCFRVGCRFSRRSRFAAGICSGLARMIATMRSLNSSSVSTGRCCCIRFCDEFVMKFSQISVLPWQRVRESNRWQS